MVKKCKHYETYICKKLTKKEIINEKVKIKLDPYRIAQLHNIKGGPKEHILKKVLRGAKKNHTEEQIIEEIRQACDRWEEMIKENINFT